VHWRDFGSILWVLVVIGGVVSSVRKAASRSQSPASARLERPPRAATTAPPAAAPPKSPRAVTIGAQALADAAYRMQLAASVAPPSPEPAAAMPMMPMMPTTPTMPAMPAMPAMESFGELAPAQRPTSGAPPLRGRNDWARGVVVAELLAPPLAMRESGPPTW